MEFPELARMQNTWRSVTGYEYHFYTPKQEIIFIKEHYPTIVMKTYDAIVGSQRRRDLFKLLVLYKLGGIFANVDIMLETNLDALIEPTTSFMVPRDPGLLSHNCLWNGLLAAEPGHPLLAKTIERVIRIVLTGSQDDEGGATHERFLLHDDSSRSTGGPKHESVDIWKLRTGEAIADQYIYSGCALGVAVNNLLAADNSPVKDFDVLGKQPLGISDGGDLRILMVRDASF